MDSERQDFIAAQQGMLDRFRVEARSRFVDVPSIEGQARLLLCGAGPPLVVVNGIGTPSPRRAVRIQPQSPQL